MAKAATIGLILIISTLLLLTPNACARKQGLDDAEEITFFRDVCGGKEKIVKLEVYLHDLRVGNTNPTVFQVAKASITDTSATSFGTVNAVDDLLTAGPDINSKAIGRIQGLTTSADQAVNGVALNLNIVFTVGRFNGSTISILGRNQIQKERPALSDSVVDTRFRQPVYMMRRRSTGCSNSPSTSPTTPNSAKLMRLRLLKLCDGKNWTIRQL